MLFSEYLDFYQKNFFAVIPLKPKAKAPAVTDWQNRRPEDFNPAEFADNANVGIVLGGASGGLIDIDLDCEEALALAPIFLPPTGFRFGRKSKPDSHRFYHCQHPGKTVRLAGSNGRVLLECRGNGGQTVVPPSVHPIGEVIEFSEMGAPALADFDDLVLRCRLMAIAIKIAPNWKLSGRRHDFSLAFAGALLRAGVSQDHACQVIRGVCRLAQDEEEEEDRLRSVQSTAEKIFGANQPRVCRRLQTSCETQMRLASS
jgi:hypothetical protein